jgi:hypothetical protein
MKKRNGYHPNPSLLSEAMIRALSKEVLSEAITQLLSEEELERIEVARLQQMAKDSERAIREGHVYTHAEVKEALRKGNLKGLIEKREREWHPA